MSLSPQILTRKRVRSAPHGLALALACSLTLALSACNDDGKNQIRTIKEENQRAFGNKDFAKVLTLSQKGLELALKASGAKSNDAIIFAVALSDANISLHNTRGAIAAMKQELDMRAAAGQAESKLQPRRTLLIKIAEESGDVMTAGAQAAAVARGINMSAGKDPQPVYKAPLALQTTGEGDVDISYGLDANGAVVSAQVVKSNPPQVFDQVALDTFKKWRFTPMLDQSGRPVSASGFKFTMMFRQR